MTSGCMTPVITRFESVPSTNVTAREMAGCGAAEGTVVIAREQTRGKGRGERLWHSPPGGIYLSALLYPADVKRTTDLSLLAGVALAQSVKELLPKSVEVSVKWPNDCLLNWKKVGGILCESLGEDVLGLWVVGIGLNVNLGQSELEAFQANPFKATSFLTELGGEAFDLNAAESMLISKLFSLYQTYREQGSEPIRYLWEKNCRMIGKKVSIAETGWRREDGRNRDVGVATGTVLGIDENGAIVLANAKGERRSYYSGEITCYWP